MSKPPRNLVSGGFPIPSAVCDTGFTQRLLLYFPGGRFGNFCDGLYEAGYGKTWDQLGTIIQNMNVVDRVVPLGNNDGFHLVFAASAINTDADDGAFFDVWMIV